MRCHVTNFKSITHNSFLCTVVSYRVVLRLCCPAVRCSCCKRLRCCWSAGYDVYLCACCCSCGLHVLFNHGCLLLEFGTATSSSSTTETAASLDAKKPSPNCASPASPWACAEQGFYPSEFGPNGRMEEMMDGNGRLIPFKQQEEALTRY